MELFLYRPVGYLVIALFSCLILSSGCVKDAELLDIENMEFLEQDGDYVLINFTGSVKNPNKVGAKINKIEAKIFIEENEVGTVNEEQIIKMKRKETKSISLKSKIDLAVLSKLFPSIMSKDSTWVNIEGIYYVSTGIHPVKLKFKTRKKMALREEIEKQVEQKLSEGAFDISKIRLNGGGISESSWTMEVNLENTFGIKYAIDSIHLDLFLPDRDAPFGSWKLVKPISIEAGTSETITAEVKIDNGKAMSQLLFNIFGSKEILISGMSYANINNHPFTIPISQQVPISGL